MTATTIKLARVAAIGAATLALTTGGVLPAAAQGTPAAGMTEDRCATVMGTPAAGMGGMGGMDAGSPRAGMDMAEMMEPDQMYIDMVIPHHAAIIAMAEAALPRLQDERLQEIARRVIATQGPEIEELRGYREQFYGDPEPMPMDDQMMAAMGEMLPGMSGTIDEMAFQMDAAAQVAAICGAADTDLAFIDLTIAHHQMAIASSEIAVAQATRQEIRDFAQRVIEDQTRESEELRAIRQELYGSATPEPVGA